MTSHHNVSNNPPFLFKKIHLLLESVNILSPTCSINKVEFQIRLHIETIMLCCYSSLSPLLPPPPLTACLYPRGEQQIHYSEPAPWLHDTGHHLLLSQLRVTAIMFHNVTSRDAHHEWVIISSSPEHRMQSCDDDSSGNKVGETHRWISLCLPVCVCVLSVISFLPFGLVT